MVARYGFVVHLVTCAIGAPDFYNNDNNKVMLTAKCLQ